MKEKKRLEIFWEMHEITTISFKEKRRVPVFCRTCQSDALHLSAAEAAALLKIGFREISRQSETGKIHGFETETGALLVCHRSLKK